MPPLEDMTGKVVPRSPNVAHPGYEVVPGWPALPAGMVVGEAVGVEVDSQNHVFFFHRADKSWGNSTVIDKDTVVTVDGATGQVLATWGKNLFLVPHGLTVDQDDNVWVTDVMLNQVLQAHARRRAADDGRRRERVHVPDRAERVQPADGRGRGPGRGGLRIGWIRQLAGRRVHGGGRVPAPVGNGGDPAGRASPPAWHRVRRARLRRRSGQRAYPGLRPDRRAARRVDRARDRPALGRGDRAQPPRLHDRRRRPDRGFPFGPSGRARPERARGHQLGQLRQRPWAVQRRARDQRRPGWKRVRRRAGGEADPEVSAGGAVARSTPPRSGLVVAARAAQRRERLAEVRPPEREAGQGEAHAESVDEALPVQQGDRAADVAAAHLERLGERLEARGPPFGLGVGERL